MPTRHASFCIECKAVALRILHVLWFPYGQASCFFAAGQARPGSIFGALYLLLAVLIFRLRWQTWKWRSRRRLHAALVAFTACAFLTAVSLVSACALGAWGGVPPRTVVLVGLGGLGKATSSAAGGGCGNIWAELVVLTGAVLGWLVARKQKDEDTLEAEQEAEAEAEVAVQQEPGTASPAHGAISPLIAPQTPPTGAAHLARGLSSSSAAPLGSGVRRDVGSSASLGAVLALQAKAWGLQLWSRSLVVGAGLVICAGLEQNLFACCYQFSAVAMCLRLAWAKAPPLFTEYRWFRMLLISLISLHVSAVVVLGFSVVNGLVPALLLRLLGAGTFAPTASMPVTDAAIFAAALQRTVAFFLAAVLARWPCASQEPSAEGEGLQLNTPEPPATPMSGASVEGADDTGIPPRASRDRHSRSGGGLGAIMSPVFRKLQFLFSRAVGGRLLPMLSALIWPVAWPSLPALPLLLCGVIFMRVPPRRWKMWALSLLLAFEALLVAVVYVYNVYCAMYALPPSAVPSRFAKLEMFGLQSFARPVAFPGVTRLSFVVSQALSVYLLAVSLRILALRRIASTADVQESDVAAEPTRVQSASSAALSGRPLEATEQQGPLQGAWIAARRWAVVCARVLTAAAIAGVGLAGEHASAIRLGYVLCFVAVLWTGCAAPLDLGRDDADEQPFVRERRLLRERIAWDCVLAYAAVAASWILVATLFSFDPNMTSGVDIVASRLSFAASANVSNATAVVAGMRKEAYDITIVARSLGQPLLVGVLAASQIRMLASGTLAPAVLRDPQSIVCCILQGLAIFPQIGLMFAAVVVAPAAAFQFFLLLVFIGIVAAEQFSRFAHWKMPLLAACAFITGAYLPARYVLSLSFVDAWVSKALPEAQYPLLWDLLGKQPGSTATPADDLVLPAALLLTLSCLRRAQQFWMKSAASLALTESGRAGSDGALVIAQRLLRDFPLLARVVMLLATCSPLIVIVVAYCLSLAPDFLSRVRMVTLLIILLAGRHWEHTGSFVSVLSMATLLAQYLLRFDYLRPDDERFILWTGLGWKSSLVSMEISLSLLGIAQNALLRTAKRHLRPHAAPIDTSGFWGNVRDESTTVGAHIGAVLVLYVALCNRDAWALAGTCVVLAFVARGCGYERLPQERSNHWLKAFALVLVLALLTRWGLETWFPPIMAWMPDKLTSGDLATWPVCDVFNGEFNVTNTGAACVPDDIVRASTSAETCMTQRLRCGIAWAEWVGLLPGEWQPTSEFMALFLVCILRKSCLSFLKRKARNAQLSASATPAVSEEAPQVEGVPDCQPAPDERRAAPSSHRREHSPRDLHELEPIEDTQLLGESKSDEVSLCRADSQIPSEMPLAALDPRPADAVEGQSARAHASPAIFSLAQPWSERRACVALPRWPIILYRSSAVALWFSLVGAAVSQLRANLYVVGYLMLLFRHVYTTEKAPTLDEPLQARLRVLRQIRFFNIVMLALFMIFQCPSMPCSYELGLTENVNVTKATNFVSPEQCEMLELHSVSFVNSPRGIYRLMSVLLQSLGVEKRATMYEMFVNGAWNVAVFALAMSQTVMAAFWREELSASLAATSQRLSRRGDFYKYYITKWRRLELQHVNTKYKVLHAKLQELIAYLDDFRARTTQTTSHHTVARPLPALELAARERRLRIMDLCLQNGASFDDVSVILAEVEAAARRSADESPDSEGAADGIDEDADAALAPDVQRACDQVVLETLANKDLCTLQKISVTEETERRSRLLERWRPRAPSLQSWLAHGAVTARSVTLTPPPSPHRLAAAAPKVETAGSHASGAGVVSPDAVELHDSADTAARGASSPESALESGSAAMQDMPVPPERVAAADDDTEGAFSRLLHASCRLLESMIDDPLFVGDGHATLWTHRRNNGPWLLLGKAVLSCTDVLVLGATMIQFASYRCVLASVNVSMMVVSFMMFPHVHPRMWWWMQMYNSTVIAAKLLYQAPIFCLDGSIDLFGCTNADSSVVSADAVTWAAVLGIMKVWPAASQRKQESVLAFDSMAGAIWSDMLLVGALLLHCHVLYHGGRMQDTPDSICALLRQDDAAVASGSTGTPAASFGGDGGRARMARGASSTSDAEAEEVMADSIAETEDEEALDAMPEGLLARLTSVRQRALESWRQFFFMGAVYNSSGIQKPAMDLYVYRFALAMACLALLLLRWNAMTGTGRSFADSLSANVFSGTMVLSVIAFVVMVVADRALYTCSLQTQTRLLVNGEGSMAATASTGSAGAVLHGLGTSRRAGHFGPSSSRTSSAVPSESSLLRRSTVAIDLDNPAADTMLQQSDAAQRRSQMVTFLQMSLLLVQLIVLHTVCVVHWSKLGIATRMQTSLFANWDLLFFYLLYVIFLALTSLQLKYDVHVLRGGLSLNHSTDIVPWLLYKGYSAIPFLDEFRVLTDWTVTPTSMNFFMWMKLEDAHQSLFKTRTDMEARQRLPWAAPRPLSEKILQGGLLLLALIALVVGPLLYFSTANLLGLRSNMVYAASLRAYIVVQTASGGANQLGLYETGQARIKPPELRVTRDTFATAYSWIGSADTFDLQNVSFPSSADSFWLVSNSLRTEIARDLRVNTTLAWLHLAYQFRGNVSDARGIGDIKIELSLDEREIIADALSMASPNKTAEETVALSTRCPQGFQRVVFVDSAGKAASMGETYELMLSVSKEAGQFPMWSMEMATSPCKAGGLVADTEQEVPAQPHRQAHAAVTFTVASERDVGAQTSSGSGSSGGAQTYSVMGFYLGVVYTIGRFLRLVFQDSSKRMIYEELSDTALLQDLCNGIYIARITGDLEIEFEFYYELIRLYRSPELLLVVSPPPAEALRQGARHPRPGLRLRRQSDQMAML